MRFKAHPGDAVDYLPEWLQIKRNEKIRDTQRKLVIVVARPCI